MITVLPLILAIPFCQEPNEPVVTPVEVALAAGGVKLDREAGIIVLNGAICQDQEPLEYLLVKSTGDDHEALLQLDEDVSAAAVNTAMLLLDAKPGQNGKLVRKDPLPTREEYEAGASLYDVVHAKGDGFYIYVGWEQTYLNGETERWFYRAEDLVINSRRTDTYQRGKFVYLGSRFIKAHSDAPELFAADASGNLVSLVYFNPANHLLTGADPEANDQYVWYPNTWLLPTIGTPIKVWLSRSKLAAWPQASAK